MSPISAPGLEQVNTLIIIISSLISFPFSKKELDIVKFTMAHSQVVDLVATKLVSDDALEGRCDTFIVGVHVAR